MSKYKYTKINSVNRVENINEPEVIKELINHEILFLVFTKDINIETIKMFERAGFKCTFVDGKPMDLPNSYMFEKKLGYPFD